MTESETAIMELLERIKTLESQVEILITDRNERIKRSRKLGQSFRDETR